VVNAVHFDGHKGLDDGKAIPCRDRQTPGAVLFPHRSPEIKNTVQFAEGKPEDKIYRENQGAIRGLSIYFVQLRIAMDRKTFLTTNLHVLDSTDPILINAWYSQLVLQATSANIDLCPLREFDSSQALWLLSHVTEMANVILVKSYAATVRPPLPCSTPCCIDSEDSPTVTVSLLAIVSYMHYYPLPAPQQSNNTLFAITSLHHLERCHSIRH
jgi:hypothetical protein